MLPLNFMKNGKADYIAFMTPDRKGFLCVNREELKEWCQEHVKAEIVTSSYDALYKLYAAVPIFPVLLIVVGFNSPCAIHNAN